jgi:hypothetical protein
MPPEYLRLLEVDDDFDMWTSKDVRNLKFGWGITGHREDHFHAVAAAREGDFDDKVLSMYGGRDERSAYLAVVDEELNGLLSRWALLALFAAFERYLTGVRDSMKTNKTRKALGLFKNVSDFVTRGTDIAALSAELATLANFKLAFLHDVGKFSHCEPKRFHDENTALAEVLREHVAGRAASLEKTERVLRDLMIQQGGVRSAQQLGLLTWVLVVLTVALLVLTVLLARADISKFLDWVKAVL